MPLLASIRSSYIPMAPLTSIAFICLGGLLLVHSMGASQAPLCILAAMFSALLSAYVLIELVVSLGFPFPSPEEWLFPNPAMLGTIPTARMSPVTEVLFLLSGAVVPMLYLRERGGERRKLFGDLAGCLGILVAVSGAVVVLSYVHKTPILYGTSTIPMATTTALAFLLLGIGQALAAGPDGFPLRPFVGPSARAKLLRAFVSTTIGVVVAIDLLHVYAHWIFFEDHAFLSGVSTMAFAVIAAALIARVALKVGGDMDRSEEVRKQTEWVLTESEEKFRAIFEGSIDGMIQVDMENKKFRTANSTFCDMVQYTLDEIRQLGILDIHPEEDVPWILEEFDRRARKETEKEIDIPVKRKDGSIFWAEVKSSPVTISGKEFVLGSFRDITERRKAEEKVKESEDRFRDLVEHSQSLICTHDLEGRILSANPWAATVLGYSQDELLRMNLRDFIAPEVRYEFVGYLEKIRKHGVAQGMLLVQTRNGEQRIWEYKNTLRTEGVTEPVVRGMAQDITERKRGEVEKARLEAQLRQAQKMESVGRLAGGVAHDFNNLLTVITGYSELLLQKIGKESPMHGEVEEIKRAGERASSLTQQLLAFSRKQIIEPKVILLDSMVAETHKMLARLIGENIDLQTITGKSPGTVKVDPGQFQQILMNLAVNARDAMPDGGKIVIETANVDLDEGYCALHPYVKPGRFVMLAVSDTGKGMSEEVKTHIFEPFFTTKEMGSGTGLGLATTYGAVHQAGGSIEVYSEVGIGTTFKIYLPRVEEAVVKPEKDDHPTDLPGGTETVLLVEDEEMVRELGVQILERLGYKVLWGSNGTEAIAIAEKYDNRIDLLLTDVVMPGMNGSELATQLVLHHPEMEVLFTSGYTDETITRHGVLDEGVSFIGKPYTLSALARKVRGVLDKA